jgi:hypothetical protein
MLLALGPSSESLQGRNPREMRLVGCRVLWGFGLVGRGDGFGGGATDAMFAVGTEVAAVR